MVGEIVRKGGCWFCRHSVHRPGSLRCAHPGYPMPTHWLDARDDVTRCGLSGHWWEPRFEPALTENNYNNLDDQHP